MIELIFDIFADNNLKMKAVDLTFKKYNSIHAYAQRKL